MIITMYNITPTTIFHDCKNDNFLMKNCDIFLIFAQNIDSGDVRIASMRRVLTSISKYTQ